LPAAVAPSVTLLLPVIAHSASGFDTRLNNVARHIELGFVTQCRAAISK
jgi:hypothetical protein